jgi:hydrogenase maturation protein HypF
LARRFGLRGWVRNTKAGAEIEVEGRPEVVAEFESALGSELAYPARVVSIDSQKVPSEGGEGFVVAASETGDEASGEILEDLPTCGDCLNELFDPESRFFGYPFLNCTRCGPRFSVFLETPYDRARTTMREFPMCEACRAEYESVENRRFHAQPTACPRCGPELSMREAVGAEALGVAVEALRGGEILAVKGIGGFHLMVDAESVSAVSRLRERKGRGGKAFAVMAPSLEWAEERFELSAAEVDQLEKSLIVLVRCDAHALTHCAPDSPDIGLLLPYNPLYHQLARAFEGPLVVTSGNLSDEPICYENEDAEKRLSGIADTFLLHNRCIARPVEDSVVRQVKGVGPQVLRVGRALAPLYERWGYKFARPTVAVGGQMKCLAAAALEERLVVGSHIGDLDSVAGEAALEASVRDLEQLLETPFEQVVCDMHPDYASTRVAERMGKPIVRVQHHLGHAFSVWAEHPQVERALAVVWDGTGYGPDGTIWGGEFFLLDNQIVKRVAAFREFKLVGGDLAAREPYRVALALLNQIDKNAVEKFAAGLDGGSTAGVVDALARGQGLRSSSAGRLFDAVAAITGLAERNEYEAQAAVLIERAWEEAEPYPFDVLEDALDRIDWRPAIESIWIDRQHGEPLARISGRWHAGLVELIVEMARRNEVQDVMMTGGCFQNAVLTSLAARRLSESGLRARFQHRHPMNDGGLAVGQLAAAAYQGKVDLACA